MDLQLQQQQEKFKHLQTQLPLSNNRLLVVLLCWLFTFQQLWTASDCTHITGTFQTDEFFKFIIKFGFQKAETHSQRDSFGYIYGNITSEDSFAEPITLAVLDRATFVYFYGNRSYGNRDYACQQMFHRLKALAYDADCNPNGKRDFLRRIPCPRGRLCADEDAKSNVLPENQLTYVIKEVTQPRFWYVAAVACYRNRSSCDWHAYNPHQPKTITYDLRLVNAHPNDSAARPLTYEFSFEQQNLLEMYLIFLLVYVVLVPVQIYAVRLQKHPVTRLFTLSLLSEFVSLMLIAAHYIEFAMNGEGMPDLQAAGDILDILSRTTFMLILLLLAKGWAVTRQQINRSGWILLMIIWVPYCAFHVLLYVWDRTEVDIISDIDEYQTWPGWIVLILRTSFMMWFLFELRNTMKYEHSTKKLDFLLHLGASSLVWFIYLPIVAMVALQVSPMWRYKLLLGITNSADCLAYCVMTGLLWPNRSGQYLLLAGNKYAGMDELDEFNEAPHIVRERERRRNSPPDAVAIVGATDAAEAMGDPMDGCNGENGGAGGRRGSATGHDTSGGSGNGPMKLSVASKGNNHHHYSATMNGDACTDLLEAEDLNVDLLTDLHKHSHVVA